MDFDELPTMSLSMVLNELRLFVDITSKEDKHQCLASLREMGFNPKAMKYSWDKEGIQVNEICAFLHREIVEEKDPLERMDDFNTQYDALADVFGSENVCLVLGTAE